MAEDSFLWGLFAVIILLDLYISAIKAAFTYAHLPYLLGLKEQDERELDRAIKVMGRPRVRTTLRLAMMTTHLLAGGLLVLGLSWSLLQDASTWIFILWVVGALVLLALLEYLIEGVVLKSPESAVLKLARPAMVLDIIFAPLAWLTTALLGEKASVATLETMTEAELRNWVEEGQPQGSLEKGERQMIYSIFHFGDTFAREVMVPRVDVLAVDVTSTIGEARQALLNSGHSRVPVFEDTVDNVIGLLYAKDLLAVQNDSLTLDSQRQILRGAYFVPEAKKVDELLEEMQARGVHMALVVDEYGGVAGVVTLEDIVEEIVGEIRDEYDEKEEYLYQLINEHEYLFSGRIGLDDFNDLMESHVVTENADSLGGFIYGELGHVPLQGEAITIDGITLKVENVIGRRILKVRATKDQPISLSGDEAYAD